MIDDLETVRKFLEKVIFPLDLDNECWIFQSADLNKFGHKGFIIPGKRTEPRYAHRVSYEIYIGDLTPKDCVCHKCDNPSCVNPNHLFKGSKADNIHDKVSKNRQSRGAKHSESISSIPNEVVLKILKLKNSGRTQKSVAEEYNCSYQHICSLWNRKRRTDLYDQVYPPQTQTSHYIWRNKSLTKVYVDGSTLVINDTNKAISNA